MKKITAIIPCKNEEKNIEAVLESVSFADEIMVVDSFSTDRTVELAKKHTNFILEHEYKYSAAQKNWAIPQASNEWILLIDADERVTPKLKAEIQNILKSQTDKAGFWIYRNNFFMGQRIKFSGFQGDKVIRLFKKSKCKYEDKHVHAEIISDDEIGYLKGHLDHYTYKGIDHFVAKTNRYAWWSAKDYKKKTGKLNAYHFIIKPGFRILKHYFIKQGFRDGVPGLTIAFLSAYTVFMRFLKIWIIRQNIEEDKPNFLD